MLFIIFREIGKLTYNAIVKRAFEKMMFEKLQLEGYCDINPLKQVVQEKSKTILHVKEYFGICG